MLEDGVKMSGKEAGKKWKALSDSEQKPFIDEYNKAKKKYEKYLESQGITKGSAKKAEKPTCFKGARIRAICGRDDKALKMDSEVYKGLGKVLVS